MFGVKSVIYENNNEFLIIDIGDECKVSYKNISRVIDNKIVYKYLESLLIIVSNWRSEYINIGIIDGEIWKLTLNLIDGSKKEYNGRSDFPINFESFEFLNREIIKEVL